PPIPAGEHDPARLFYCGSPRSFFYGRGESGRGGTADQDPGAADSWRGGHRHAAGSLAARAGRTGRTERVADRPGRAPQRIAGTPRPVAANRPLGGDGPSTRAASIVASRFTFFFRQLTSSTAPACMVLSSKHAVSSVSIHDRRGCVDCDWRSGLPAVRLRIPHQGAVSGGARVRP